MLNSKQIVKIGRTNKIMEVNDKLQVNNFYNETGYDHSELHGRFSRLQIVLVDTKDGKGEKAKVGKFNFTEEEFSNVIKVLGLYPKPSQYKQKALDFNKKYKGLEKDYLSSFKMHSYEKDPQGYCGTTNIMLTYEENMRNDSKWKITIDIGRAIPEEISNGNGGSLISPKKGSYKKLKTATINITQLELEYMLQGTWKYLKQWEQNAFPKMLQYREQFEKRCERNNYNEDTMKEWNRYPFKKKDKSIDNNDKQNNDNKSYINAADTINDNHNSSHVSSQTRSNIVPVDNSKKKQDDTIQFISGCTCQETGCKNTVNSEAVWNFSVKTYGIGLCNTCANARRLRGKTKLA